METRRQCRRVSLPLAVVIATGRCGAQVPVTAGEDGGVRVRGAGVGAGPAWGEAVVVEAFFDQLCAYAPTAATPGFGARRVAVVVHLFPLPYHNSSFIACRSIHALHKLNESAVYPLLEKFFKYQEGYYNTPTYNTPTYNAEITNNLVTPVIGDANLAAYRAGFNDSWSDQAARISFKFGCAQGVTGTPYYFINGIPLNDLDFPLDYDKWISMLDPLIGKM